MRCRSEIGDRLRRAPQRRQAESLMLNSKTPQVLQRDGAREGFEPLDPRLPIPPVGCSAPEYDLVEHFLPQRPCGRLPFNAGSDVRHPGDTLFREGLHLRLGRFSIQDLAPEPCLNGRRGQRLKPFQGVPEILHEDVITQVRIPVAP